MKDRIAQKPASPYLRIDGFAAYMGVSPRTVREWMRLRLVPFIKIRRAVFFDFERAREALQKFERK